MRFLKARRKKPSKPLPRRPRRWLRRVVLITTPVVAFMVLGASGFWFTHSVRVAATVIAFEQRALAWTGELGLAVANVQVEGRERANREAILSALDVARGTPILAVDPMQAKRQLESIPWVRSASVERRLPDTLYIHLVERQPLAFWQRQGKLVLVDRDGAIIPHEQLGDFGNLIVLVGSDAPAKGAALLDMLATEPDLVSHVAAAVLIGDRRWNLRLDNSIDIALPEEDAASAWHRLAQLERSDRILERDVQMVDLRLPDRLVVRAAPDVQKTAPKKGRQPGKTT